MSTSPMKKENIAARSKRAEGKTKTDEIIAVSRSEFARLGYRGVTMRGIAEAAGVSTRTVYNNFEDKLALFTACVNGSTRMPKIDQDGDIALVLHRLAADLLIQLSSPLAHQISLMIFRDGSEFPELKMAAKQNFEIFLILPLAAFLERNGVQPDDAPRYARLFANMATAEWNNRVLFNEPPQTQADADLHVRTVTDVFLKGLPTSSLQVDESGGAENAR